MCMSHKSMRKTWVDTMALTLLSCIHMCTVQLIGIDFWSLFVKFSRGAWTLFKVFLTLFKKNIILLKKKVLKKFLILLKKCPAPISIFIFRLLLSAHTQRTHAIAAFNYNAGFLRKRAKEFRLKLPWWTFRIYWL
jgi:hypothetical protein